MGTPDALRGAASLAPESRPAPSRLLEERGDSESEARDGGILEASKLRDLRGAEVHTRRPAKQCCYDNLIEIGVRLKADHQLRSDCGPPSRGELLVEHGVGLARFFTLRVKIASLSG